MENIKYNSNSAIYCDDLVKVKILGNEAIIQKIQHCNRTPVMKKQSKSKYINTATGEIINCKNYTTRGDGLSSLRYSNEQLSNIIKLNAPDVNKILYVTLTYREKQFGSKQVQLDFRQFIKALRKKYIELGAIEYINVYELHADDSYHIHVDLFFNDSRKIVKISESEIEKIWGHGYVRVGRPASVNEMTTYLTPHIVKEITAENENMNEKALRQQKLPAGQRLYHCSKGIKRPKIFKLPYNEGLLEIEDKGFRMRGEARYPSPMIMKNGNNQMHVKQYFEMKVSN